MAFTSVHVDPETLNNIWRATGTVVAAAAVYVIRNLHEIRNDIRGRKNGNGEREDSLRELVVGLAARFEALSKENTEQHTAVIQALHDLDGRVVALERGPLPDIMSKRRRKRA